MIKIQELVIKINGQKKAFSLVELSVVLLITGLLIGGTIGGSKLVTVAKLRNADSLTKTSPVWEIINPKTSKESAVLWLDATDLNSITMSANNTVAEWRSKITDRKATQGTEANKPIYQSTILSPFPALTFDGSNDFLDVDLPPLIEGDDTYTIAAVWKSDTISGVRSIYEQNMNSVVTHRRGALLLVHNQYGFNGQANDAHSMVPYSANTLYATVMANNIGNITIYHNTTKYTGTVTTPSSLNLGRELATIGRKHTSEYMDGYIAEIIVFDTALSDEDALLVAQYLTEKYKIR